MLQLVREAVHYGSWYQKPKQMLQKELEANLARVKQTPDAPIKAIVSPYINETRRVHLFGSNGCVWVQSCPSSERPDVGSPASVSSFWGRLTICHFLVAP